MLMMTTWRGSSGARLDMGRGGSGGAAHEAAASARARRADRFTMGVLNTITIRAPDGYVDKACPSW
jgi:hypothetical protein